MLDKMVKERLVGLYVFGVLTHHEIAKNLGLTYNQVYQFYMANRAKYNLPLPNKRNYSPITQNVYEAYKLYVGGLTLEKVGDQFGITRERVRQVFEKFGLETRNAGYSCRKYYFCNKGHELHKGETRLNCPTCRQLKKEYRAKGLHFKTHCLKGHELKGDNLYMSKYAPGKYSRRCRKCACATNRKSAKKKSKK